jgi:hypothetical protein
VYLYLKARASRFQVAEELRLCLAGLGVRLLRPDEDVLPEVAAQVMLGRLFLLQSDLTRQAGNQGGPAL